MDNTSPQPIIIRQAAPAPQQQSEVSMSDLFYICLGNWKWFVLSVVLCLSGSVLYLLRTAPVYTRTASVLIKQDSKGHSVSDVAGELSSLGLVNTNSNVNNELITFTSPALVLQLVQRMNLDINYSKPGTFRSTTLYGSTLPVQVELLDMDDTANASMVLTLTPEGTCNISDMVLKGERLSYDQSVVFGDTLQTPLGRMIVNQSAFFAQPETTLHIDVTRSNIYTAIASTSAKLKAGLSNKQASIIDLTYSDVNIQRAEDVLNALITIYNQNWVQDKNQISVATSQFVNDRLEMIEQELGNVDTDISSYKSQNLIPDVNAATQMYMNKASQAESQVMELNNQLYMCRYVRQYVTNDANKNQLLPANSGINASNIEAMITAYNNKLLERNTLAANSSTRNPLVVDMDAELLEQRRTIVLSLDNQITALQTQVRSQESAQMRSTSQLSTNPTRQKYLLSVERQQKVKESLYLFLLQKREENELSQAFTAYNSRVVTPPSGSNWPTFPVAKNVYILCLLIGFLLPCIIIILAELVNTSVRGRKDLDVLNIPFLGEIPLNNPDNRVIRFFKRIKKRLTIETKSSRLKEDKTLHILVKEGKTDIMNEAFRMARTNMEFIAGRSDEARVIMLTSFNPNSGKTFVVSNLSVALTLKNQRVLCIDLDMRKRSLSAMVGKRLPGLSNYLGGYIDDYHQVIKTSPLSDKLDIFPAGKIPPNPTELLFEPRLDDLLKQLRKEYDYIFLDCPPLEIVADASIIARLADMSIFVVRAEGLQRTALPDVQKLYDEKRLPKMTILLNGTTDAFSRYGYHRYGSRYGYSYGYGRSYSYGYGYADAKDDSEGADIIPPAQAKKN